MVFIHNIDPVLLHLGPIEIRYYGLAYVLGLIISYFIIKYLIKQKQLPLSEDDLLDLMMYLAVGIILGGRLFYTLVYNLPYYLQHPLEIFAIWQGGMSFHGGLLGVIIAGYLFCRKKKLSFYQLADLVVIPTALALMIGRIANFINGELYGRPWLGHWADQFGVDFGDGIIRYPSQLFESFKNLVIFIILWLWYKKDNPQRPHGVIFWLFITLYGLFRFIIEFYRQPDEQLGFIISNFTMGQVLTLPMFLLGMGVIIYLYRRKS